MICSVQNCGNEKFENLDKCALHCSEYYITSKLSYKQNIKKLFKNYIYRCLSLATEEYKGKNLDSTDNIFINGLKEGYLDVSYFNELDCVEIHIMYVHLHKNIDYEGIIDKDLKYIFERVKCIIYDECSLAVFFYEYTSKSYYYNCVFEEKITFTDKEEFPEIIRDKHKEYVFQDCKFNSGLSIQNPSVDKKVVERKVFYNCKFKEIYLFGIVFKDEFLYFCDENVYDGSPSGDPVLCIENITIYNCIFEKSLSINGMKIGFDLEILRKYDKLLNISKIDISDCEFKEHLEIKRANIKGFLIKKTSIHKTFDASSSSFGLLLCNRVNFLDSVIF